MGALRGGSRKCLVMRHLSGDSMGGGHTSAALGCRGQVRRRSGACPARLPCGSCKALELLHLCRECCILHCAFCLRASHSRRLPSHGQAPPFFHGVPSDEMQLCGKVSRLCQAGAGLYLRRFGAPGSPLLFGQRLVLAPSLGGGAESGPGALLGRGARVSGNNMAAPMEFTVPPPIDIAATPAAHEPVRTQELGVRLQVYGFKGGGAVIADGSSPAARVLARDRRDALTHDRGTHRLDNSIGYADCQAAMDGQMW
jgi:hypothetical protein